MKILTLLKEMRGFTPNEQSIAAYVLQHPENCLSLSIHELARAAFTSHSAVVRLTRKLGLAGFKEFKIKLAQELQQSLQQISGVDPNLPFQVHESSIQVAKGMAELLKETIEKTFVLLDDELLNRSAEMLNRAKRIFIFALGDSQIRAQSFQNKLIKINKYAIIATELAEWAHHTVNMTPEDCAVFLTYHNKSPIYLKAARHLKNSGAPILTITSSARSELAALSTICIQVPNDELSYAKIGTFSSQIAFEYVLNVLYSCIYKIDYPKNRQTALQSLSAFRTFDMMQDI
ncbi:MurR/RpiR family transcriptional regulator [Paenibacillus oralis]|uniref:MurR/RpiR family transcriptional regulator n=1 Tax=Paenibacillus oralis TaxID=2490856 RepID=A0A3P3U249_9BACL|nr:MurR/RpiR family transcriptional regulator [Paenibacillus oralis]RRJ64415.1 MurR/RpiR family transcriptional regulator [Paenibacillus oralis]